MPDWSGPVVRYILEVGLPTTLRISAFAVVGSAIVQVIAETNGRGGDVGGAVETFVRWIKGAAA